MTIVFNANAKEFGYIIYVSDKNLGNIENLKTESEKIVRKSIFVNTGLDVEVDKIFEGGNVLFEYRNNDIYYYCEKRIINQKV